MRTRLVGLILAAAAFVFAPVLLAQTSARPGSGESAPDLSGIWMARGGDIRDFTQELPSLTPWAAAMYRTHREGTEGPFESGLDELDPSIYCLPDGFPRVYLVTYPFEIVQTSGTVYMLFEKGLISLTSHPRNPVVP